MDRSLKIILLETLSDYFTSAKNNLDEFRNKLPEDYRGFVDIQLNNLKLAHAELAKDIDFYAGRSCDDSMIIKSFKIHCSERFLPIIVMSEPEHILSYGITFTEYLTPSKTK